MTGGDAPPGAGGPPAWRRYLRFWGSDVGADVDDELRFHVEALEAEYRAAGHAPAAAREAALRRFGDYERVAAACRAIDQLRERDVRRADWWGAFRQDVHFALRSMRRAPGFTAVVLLTLALGIGATTAIFTVVKGVLLEPLPFAQPERLARVWQANTQSDEREGRVSENDLNDWRASDAVRRAVTRLGAYFYVPGGSGVDLTGAGDPARLDAAAVDSGFFPTLGVSARLGRVLREEENVPGRHQVVVLSDGAWRRRFGADPSVVGRALTVDGAPHVVVGVMPAGFDFPSPRVEVWVPLARLGEDDIPRRRDNRFLDVVARLAPGATPEGARDAVAAESRRLAAAHPGTNAQWGAATVETLRDALVGDVRASLLVLLGAVACVLLIACANISGLLLSRAAARERELAVRTALGAGRARLVRQMVTESLALAVAGGLLGLLVAAAGVRALAAMAAGELPRLAGARLDGGVLLFAFGAALASGLLFGLWPALRLSSGALAPALRAGGRGLVGGGQRARGALVVAEVALAVMLVVGAGLMARSLQRLAGVDPGFRPGQVVAVSLSMPEARTASQESSGAYYAALLERIRAVPGVRAVGGVKDLPFRGKGESWPVTTPERPVAKGNETQVMVLHIAGDYFQALGTPLLRGRSFTMRDRGDGAAFGAVVNQALARQLWPGQDAVGRSLQVGSTTVPVHGVVADIRQGDLTAPPPPAMYVHALQNPRSRVNFVIRAAGDPTRVVDAVRRAIWSVEPTQTITSVTTLDDLLGETVARPRVIATLLALFGGLGLVVGALGLYGLLASMVAQRRREIGVRIALGARPADVFRHVVGQGASLAGLGIVAGLAGAFALGRVVEGVLYEVSARDPLTYAASAAILGAVALAASALPALRAVRVDPAIALRSE